MGLLLGMIPSMVNGMVLRKMVTTGATLALLLTSSSAAQAAPKPHIVSSVSEWGYLAREVVGTQATVQSLLTDPNADPHQHEASLSNATAVSQARVVLVNGAGYDSWMTRLLANQHSSTAVINVATLMKTPSGANPHLFFNLAAAQVVVKKLENLHNQKGFSSLGANFATNAKKTSIALLNMTTSLKTVAASCAGVKVAATEDIAGYLLSVAKLNVVTPKGLRLAIGNGVDPSVSDLATALKQLTQHPAFLIYNSQTVTPLTSQLLAQATAYQVPIIKIPEVETHGPYTSFVSGIISQMKRALIKDGCLK